MKDLQYLKEYFLIYKKEWINPFTNKIFQDRNRLLQSLKKCLTKEEYKFVYPTKYVRFKNINYEEILENMELEDDNYIRSPINNKKYKINHISSHLATFFEQDQIQQILYNLFSKYDQIPKCFYLNTPLTPEDVAVCGKKGNTTKHPDNPIFRKYSNKLTTEDYNKIHTDILFLPKNICKKNKGQIDFFKNSEKVKKWREKNSYTHKALDRSWVRNRTKEQREKINKKISESQKKNILEGKFTPQKNYRTKRNFPCYIDDKEYLFRSSWEICFFISHPNLKYEILRMPYEKDNKVKIYIPDFIDYDNKIIYELKPKRQYLNQIEKMDAAIKWCLEHNYKFIWINEFNLLSYVNVNDNKDERNMIYYNKVKKGVKND
jgi:hypothetical protein